MSIYIPGMEMPKDGERALWLVIHSDGTVEYEDNKGFGWQKATAIPVPEHGRLIDGDILFDFILNIYKNAQGESRKAYSDVLDVIVATGDVIPAEEGEG